MTILQSLLDNSNISNISVLASIDCLFSFGMRSSYYWYGHFVYYETLDLVEVLASPLGFFQQWWLKS